MYMNTLEFGKGGVIIVKVTFMLGSQKALVYLYRMIFLNYNISVILKLVFKSPGKHTKFALCS